MQATEATMAQFLQWGSGAPVAAQRERNTEKLRFQTEEQLVTLAGRLAEFTNPKRSILPSPPKEFRLRYIKH